MSIAETNKAFTTNLPPYRHWAVWAMLLGLTLAFMVIVATGMGYINISFGNVVSIVWAKVLNQPHWLAGMDPLLSTIVVEVRLPRILSAALVGAGLAMSGVVYQGILLNPLADPYTLGVSAGAAFGAAVALLLNLTAASLFSVPLFAFLGALTTLFFVIFLSSSAGGFSFYRVLLFLQFYRRPSAF